MIGKGRKSKAKAEKLVGTQESLQDIAGGFIEDVEKTSTSLMDEVKQLFDNLSGKVSDLAGSAVDGTTAFAQKVGKEPAHYIGGLAKEVQEAGEASVNAIGESFDALRERMTHHTAGESAGAKRSGSKKKAAKKKAAAKKKTVKRKTAPKKAPTKKKTVKRKTAAKKAPTKKRVATKKRAVTKKSVTKKTVKRKAAKKKQVNAS